MPHCFAPNCNHDSLRETCRFFRFPSCKITFAKWKRNSRRADRDPNKNDRLCACHFVDGKKENGPSIFAYNEETRFVFVSPEKRKGTKRSLPPPDADPVDVPPPDLSEPAPEEPTVIVRDVMSSAQLYFANQENEKLRELLKSGEQRMKFAHISQSDTWVFQYTGLPTAAEFNTIVSIISRFAITYYMGWKVEVLELEDQVLCALMKLRLNAPYFDLAYRFKISTTTVQNIVLTIVYTMHEIFFKGMMNIPSRQKNDLGMPSCFATFRNTRIVLDCTEIEVAIPSSMKEQKMVFSHYKQRHTFKVLVGVAPNATITFVSDLFPGSYSDKKITQESGILPHMSRGDLIVCDKGFLISDLCSPLGVNVNMPPFLHAPQFSADEVLATRRLARARIHVERAINRLKSFR